MSTQDWCEPIKDCIHEEEMATYETKKAQSSDPTNFKISESYLIGFDNGFGDDAATLTVVRRDVDRLVVVNTFTGEHAIELYNYLTTKTT